MSIQEVERSYDATVREDIELFRTQAEERLLAARREAVDGAVADRTKPRRRYAGGTQKAILDKFE